MKKNTEIKKIIGCILIAFALIIIVNHNATAQGSPYYYGLNNVKNYITPIQGK